MSLSRKKNPLYPRFSIDEYAQNPIAVKRVNDAALEYLEALRDRIEEDEELLRKKEKQIANFQKIDGINIMQSLFLVIGTILFGFGVNLATSSPHYWLGWLLSFAGCALQLVLVFISMLAKLRG